MCTLLSAANTLQKEAQAHRDADTSCHRCRVPAADVSQEVKAERSQALANIAHEQVRCRPPHLAMLKQFGDCDRPSERPGIETKRY